MNYIPAKELFEKTNGGLDVIQHYYPQAVPNKKFKLRDEKTASASVKKQDGEWLIKDFGDSQPAKNAVTLVMETENLEYKEALNFINEKFLNGNINGSNSNNFPKPQIEKVKPEKDYIFEYKEFSDKELEFLGRGITKEICEKFNVKSVAYYIVPKGYKISSSDDYFIFVYDFGDWKKVYQPYSKEYKYLHIGKRAENFIFGLQQLQNEYGNKKAKAKEKVTQRIGEGIIDYTQQELEKEIQEELHKELTDTVICSGEKDVLNVSRLGYNAICLNSETAILKKKQYDEISNYSKEIYNVPDIDSTGVQMGLRLALQYIDIKTIWLDSKLLQKKDYKGKPCKDVTDFLRYFKDSFFFKIKSVSTPMRFWDTKKNKKGEFDGYKLNNTSFYNFLEAHGYCRYPDQNNKQSYVYTKIRQNIIERIEPENAKTIVKDFGNKYLETRYEPVELRNIFYKSRITDEATSLSNLRMNDNLDFQSFGKDYQYFFFNNTAWKITPNQIKEMKLNEVDKNVWQSDIKDKCEHVKLTKKPIFEVNYTEKYKAGAKVSELDKYEITINDKDFIFLKYLQNTSRMFWRKGESITEEEQKEQDLHLINKIYSIGYLAHQYKNPSKAWAVFAMDAKESELGKSFGGSGKSICYGALKHINKQFPLQGRKRNLTQNDFLFDGVDKFTGHVFIDDANQYLDFPFFFTMITGDFYVNPKNNKPFTLDFYESPKISITSNFTLRNLDPSTERRLLYTAFSDYYHKKDNAGEYNETRTPEMEFGKNLFKDFTSDEWNKYYNFVALCIQVYMKFEKIEPPMQNIEKRNLRTAMGEDFFTWAIDYFSDNSKLNTELSKEELFEEYKNNLPPARASKQRIRKFKEAIINYTIYKGWSFNPEELTDDSNRIMRKIDGKTKEYFYLETPELKIDSSNLSKNDVAGMIEQAKGEDLPF